MREASSLEREERKQLTPLLSEHERESPDAQPGEATSREGHRRSISQIGNSQTTLPPIRQSKLNKFPLTMKQNIEGAGLRVLQPSRIEEEVKVRYLLTNSKEPVVFETDEHVKSQSKIRSAVSI